MSGGKVSIAHTDKTQHPNREIAASRVTSLVSLFARLTSADGADHGAHTSGTPMLMMLAHMRQQKSAQVHSYLEL